MKKLSLRPSPATIVACVALFVALGGTATAVTYVVSSNSQIGPGTVSGHKPPSGDHANLIPGSVNASDLAPNAVAASKLGAAAKFRRVTSELGSTRVLTLGGLAINYQCDTSVGALPILRARTTINHASMTLQANSTNTENMDMSTSDSVDLTPNFGQGEGTLVYSAPNGSVVTLDYGYAAVGNTCLVHGLALSR